MRHVDRVALFALAATGGGASCHSKPPASTASRSLQARSKGHSSYLHSNTQLVSSNSNFEHRYVDHVELALQQASVAMCVPRSAAPERRPLEYSNGAPIWQATARRSAKDLLPLRGAIARRQQASTPCRARQSMRSASLLQHNTSSCPHETHVSCALVGRKLAH